MNKRFYVTMTWDDWPEGGSYAAIIEAKDHAEAEVFCRMEMAEIRFDDEIHCGLDQVVDELSDQWHLVDCFDLDQFVEMHSTLRAKLHKVAQDLQYDLMDAANGGANPRSPTGDDANDLLFAVLSLTNIHH